MHGQNYVKIIGTTTTRESLVHVEQALSIKQILTRDTKSFSCLKRLNLKEPTLVVFMSSLGSEFQSLAPAIWKIFLPKEVLDRGILRVPWFCRFLFWSLTLLVR